MASPRFSFGFFTEEEHDSYLNLQTCVELPSSWDSKCYSEFNGEEISSDAQWGSCKQLPSLKDENQNHVPNSKNWVHDVAPNCSENRAVYLQGDNLKSVKSSAEECRTNIHNSENHILDESEGNEQPEWQIKTQNELSDDEMKCNGKNAMTDVEVNGHREVVSQEALSKETADEQSSMQTETDTLKDCSLAEKEAYHSKNDEMIQENAVGGQKPSSSDASSDGVSKTLGKPPGSWASLFSGHTQTPKQGQSIPFVEGVKSKTAPAAKPAKEQPASKKKNVTFNGGLPLKPVFTTSVVDISEDIFSKQIAEQIAKNEIVYRSPGLMPRGFINSSNWCYINATLQALLTCSPFCHLMRSFPSRQVPTDSNLVTSTPILDSFVRLVKELKPLPKRNVQRNSKEQWYGAPYEPEYIYKMLSVIKSCLSERGRQEDAEEFLCCILNGLHEEMLKLAEHHNGKILSNHHDDSVPNSPQMDLGFEVPLHEDDQEDDPERDQEDQWEEVQATRKNRSSITRRADISKTPVSEVFRGELRSDLYQEGQRGTATLEPFFTLPLDINDQSIHSVNEALEHLTRPELVKDFTNSKTKAKIEATRRMSLESMPPVLILHLKRFIYDKMGGSLKLDKEIQYHTDLVIGKDLLSKPSRKIGQEKRSYKLFAVVYHHGKKSTGGHYTTDVYHDGLNCWLRIDDHHIKVTNVHEVVRHNAQRTAYLLYYKRTDLMSV